MIRQIPHESQNSKSSSKDIAKNNTALKTSVSLTGSQQVGNQSIASTTLPEEVNISSTNDQLGSSDSMIRQIPHESQHSKLSSKDIAKNNTCLLLEANKWAIKVLHQQHSLKR